MSTEILDRCPCCRYESSDTDFTVQNNIEVCFAVPLLEQRIKEQLLIENHKPGYILECPICGCIYDADTNLVLIDKEIEQCNEIYEHYAKGNDVYKINDKDIKIILQDFISSLSIFHCPHCDKILNLKETQDHYRQEISLDKSVNVNLSFFLICPDCKMRIDRSLIEPIKHKYLTNDGVYNSFMSIYLIIDYFNSLNKKIDLSILMTFYNNMRSFCLIDLPLYHCLNILIEQQIISNNNNFYNTKESMNDFILILETGLL